MPGRPDGAMTEGRNIPDLIGAFLEYLAVERNFSLHTRLGYSRDLVQFNKFLKDFGCGKGLPADLSDVTEEAVRAFVYSLHGDLKKVSIARKLSALRSYFRFLVKKGFIKANPAELVPTPKVEKFLPSVLTVDEAQCLVEAPGAGGRPSRIGALRDLAVLELLYSSGIRVSELTGLNVKDVDMGAG